MQELITIKSRSIVRVKIIACSFQEELLRKHFDRKHVNHIEDVNQILFSFLFFQNLRSACHHSHHGHGRSENK